MRLNALPVLFEIGIPNVCGKGALEYTRSGYFGTSWPERTSFEEVTYTGSHFLVIKYAGTLATVYDYEIEFFVNPIPVNCQGSSDWCAYVSFGSTMTGANAYGMNNIIQNLPAGTYNIYLYTEYIVDGVVGMAPYLVTEGSLSTPAASSVTITSADIATDNDVLSIEINGSFSNPSPIYECVSENVNVFFEMDNLSEVLAGQYFVTAKWALVSSCGDFPLLWSSTEVTQLHLTYDGGIPTEFLKLEDLKSALYDSPFYNSANAGNRYLIHFSITNGVCPPEEYTRCVLFTDTPDLDLNLTVNLCQGTAPSAPCPGGVQGVYKNLMAVTSAPLLAYNSPTFNFSGSDGVIEYYEVTLDVLNSGGSTVTTMLQDHPIYLSASYFLDAGDVTSQNVNAWQIPKNDDIGWDAGNGFIVWASQNGYYYFLLNIRAVNGCGDSEDWTIFKVDATNAFKGIGNQNEVIEGTTDLQVYPNPFDNEITFNSPFPINQILIYDSQGKVIQYIEGFENSKVLILNSIGWNPGLFYYKIMSNNVEPLIGKVIKN